MPPARNKPMMHLAVTDPPTSPCPSRIVTKWWLYCKAPTLFWFSTGMSFLPRYNHENQWCILSWHPILTPPLPAPQEASQNDDSIVKHILCFDAPPGWLFSFRLNAWLAIIPVSLISNHLNLIFWSHGSCFRWTDVNLWRKSFDAFTSSVIRRVANLSVSKSRYKPQDKLLYIVH